VANGLDGTYVYQQSSLAPTRFEANESFEAMPPYVGGFKGTSVGQGNS
jgi:hypothetical protein